MSIQKIIIATLVALGFGLAVPTESSARRRKVVVKRKVIHHRHRVGLRHVGRGTKVKTETKITH